MVKSTINWLQAWIHLSANMGITTNNILKEVNWNTESGGMSSVAYRCPDSPEDS